MNKDNFIYALWIYRILLYDVFWTSRTLLTSIVSGGSIAFMLISAEEPHCHSMKYDVLRNYLIYIHYGGQ